MIERFLRTLPYLLLWLVAWGMGTFSQWFTYLQIQKGRMAETDLRFPRQRVSKLLVLVSGLPLSVEKVGIEGTITQVHMLIYALFVLVLGLFFPTVNLRDVNFLLFFSTAILFPLEWMITERIQKKRASAPSSLE
ncbi:MAG: hypothetical protein BWY63_00989 [Chloroflexi bacterium ADurb.Bin360]|nr:MAG: hypothetical protein BWY63_00989 [Chloroflexi bacterium ADurb.Bin360]